MTLKPYVIHQLREIQREVLVALEGLSAEDVASFDPDGRSPIAWVVEHCCGVLDYFLCCRTTGAFRLEHEERFVAWPIIESKPGEALPTPEELRERWTQVLDAAVAAIEGLTCEELTRPRPGDRPEEPISESCLRMVNHVNAHLRQIWFTLGRRGVTAKWPEQETWLA